MPDKIHPTLIQFQRLHAWNENALVYRHGSLEQQCLKIYRYLGTLAEGVQKMNGLDVAAGAGNLLANLFTCCAFTGITAEEFEYQFKRDSTGRFGSQSPAMQVKLLVAETVRAVSDLSHWDSVAGTRLSRAVALESVGLAIEALKAVASKSGIYLDRCVVNAVTSIVKKEGQLNEFGQFGPRPEPEMMFVDPNGNPPTATKPSGYTISQYITVSLRNRFDELRQEMVGEILVAPLIGKVDREINQRLDDLLEKFIRSDDERRKMLFERNPHFTVKIEQGELNVNANEDLAWLLDTLSKDQRKI
ncbi:hypothetical protein pEaSNUABM8_00258 [Erwinia phage pEa_SNUABM_8]|nr:hypothetical protein pEaSNUABM8_00258 [Erwinia phage pEa_SNUABM_8]QVW55010.1 hypothetical protein pEaSNUABM4_00257 [Erwinia phage pEa_SNUABM_4]